MLRYHVQRNQKGWVRALPCMRFQIMNTVNASTGFSGFQLHLGRSPRIIPPIVPSALPTELQDTMKIASDILTHLTDNVAEAHNNLLLTKITQTHHTSSACSAADPGYKKGDFIMLSTTNRRHEYKKKGEKRTAKFFPRWDGPYRTLLIVTQKHPHTHLTYLQMHTRLSRFNTTSQTTRLCSLPANSNSLARYSPQMVLKNTWQLESKSGTNHEAPHE
jgi:hypothetical protein